MSFLKKSEEKKKEQIEKSLAEGKQQLAEIKAKEAAAKKEAEKAARKKKLDEKRRKMKQQRFWINKKPSQRLIKFIFDMSKSNNPSMWFKNHYLDYDSYNLKEPLKKLDELES